MLVADSVTLFGRVDSACLAFPSGKVTHLIGANGSGKSSLLFCLSGLVDHSGKVEWAKENIKNWSASELSSYRGYFPQDAKPAFDLSVHQYLSTVISRIGPENAQAYHQKLPFFDEYLHILPLLDKKVSQLSGGEWQRVRLLAHFMQVWPSLNKHIRYALLDEPMTGLDILHQCNVEYLIGELANSGCTVVVANHDINQSLKSAHQIVALQAGRVITDGRPLDVLTPSLVKQVFGVDAERISINECPHLIW
ncbi:ATP-binding cassette domain-containing protein [Thaumasiovibrio subtropicus]|uniref:ATP-binding cassette domain-containing protein n=1 Tax=Thaumasiovibrio subtropicus TaxID=1891207 RepID=UPI000B34BC82|nr:ATP-binding cassette domain-containing protein [Thaumasiovibrio subtropicus]